MVSDRSYFLEEDVGGSVFIITAGKQKYYNLTEVNWSPNTKEDHNPYRNKIARIDGRLSALAVILDFYEIREGGIKIKLDGKPTCNQAKYKDGHSETLCDILQDIRN